MDISVLLTAIPNVGLAVLLVVITVWGIWKLIVPAVIKRWNDEADQRHKRELETQQYYIAEIKSLRDESRQDKQMLFAAFKENTAINTKLEQTLSDMQAQLANVSKEVIELRTDTHEIYYLLGEKRGLLRKDDNEDH